MPAKKEKQLLYVLFVIYNIHMYERNTSVLKKTSEFNSRWTIVCVVYFFRICIFIEKAPPR